VVCGFCLNLLGQYLGALRKIFVVIKTLQIEATLSLSLSLSAMLTPFFFFFFFGVGVGGGINLRNQLRWEISFLFPPHRYQLT
jgi:hypothetical protein